jgi:hypothetical protein
MLDIRNGVTLDDQAGPGHLLDLRPVSTSGQTSVDNQDEVRPFFPGNPTDLPGECLADGLRQNSPFDYGVAPPAEFDCQGGDKLFSPDRFFPLDPIPDLGDHPPGQFFFSQFWIFPNPLSSLLEVEEGKKAMSLTEATENAEKILFLIIL